MCDYVSATNVHSIIPPYNCDPVTYLPVGDVCEWPGISCNLEKDIQRFANNGNGRLFFVNSQFIWVRVSQYAGLGLGLEKFY